MIRPARRREAKRSAAACRSPGPRPRRRSAPASGCAGENPGPRSAHEAKGGVQPADRRPAETEFRAAATTLAMRANRPGSDVRHFRQRAWRPRFSSRRPGAKAPPRPSASSAPTRTRAAPRCLTRPGAIIGEVSTRRSNGQRPARATASSTAAPMEWQRPNHGRGHDGPRISPTKRVEIALEERKIVDMALAGIPQLSLRTALPAPIHRRDGEAAIEQLPDRLEILLDEFARARPESPRFRAERPREPSARFAASPRRWREPARRSLPPGSDCREWRRDACVWLCRTGRPSYRAAPARRKAGRQVRATPASAGRSLAPTRPDARAEGRSRRAPRGGDRRTARSRSRPTPTSAPAGALEPRQRSSASAIAGAISIALACKSLRPALSAAMTPARVERGLDPRRRAPRRSKRRARGRAWRTPPAWRPLLRDWPAPRTAAAIERGAEPLAEARHDARARPTGKPARPRRRRAPPRRDARRRRRGRFRAASARSAAAASAEPPPSPAATGKACEMETAEPQTRKRVRRARAPRAKPDCRRAARPPRRSARRPRGSRRAGLETRASRSSRRTRRGSRFRASRRPAARARATSD